MAMDDALIAVFDAKYTYNFWRPMSGALGAVLLQELRGQPPARLSASSPTLPGVTREWDSVEAFMDEVALARI